MGSNVLKKSASRNKNLMYVGYPFEDIIKKMVLGLIFKTIKWAIRLIILMIIIAIPLYLNKNPFEFYWEGFKLLFELIKNTDFIQGFKKYF